MLPPLPAKSVDPAVVRAEGRRLRRTIPITPTINGEPLQKSGLRYWLDHKRATRARRDSERKMERLSSRERDALKAFSYKYDTIIRRYLRGDDVEEIIQGTMAHRKINRADAEFQVAEAISHAHHIERIFARGVDADRSYSSEVYRGLHGLSDDALETLLGETDFSFGGAPSSTSHDAAQSWMRFVEPQLEGRRPPGHGALLVLRRKSPGIPMESVSQIGGEREILLHGNTRWRITRRLRMPDINGQEVWRIEAEEIVE
jgi:hypothetical protein